jgi:hypothetical protein
MRLNRRHQVTPHAWAAYDDSFVFVGNFSGRPAGANLPMITGRLLRPEGESANVPWRRMRVLIRHGTGAQAPSKLPTNRTATRRIELEKDRPRPSVSNPRYPRHATPRHADFSLSHRGSLQSPYRTAVCVRARAHAENTRRAAADGSAGGTHRGPAPAPATGQATPTYVNGFGGMGVGMLCI